MLESLKYHTELNLAFFELSSNSLKLKCFKGLIANKSESKAKSAIAAEHYRARLLRAVMFSIRNNLMTCLVARSVAHKHEEIVKFRFLQCWKEALADL